MEQKVRFKMHKVKKNWVTIGVTALSMVTVAGGTLLADQQVQADEQNPAPYYFTTPMFLTGKSVKYTRPMI